MQSPKIIVSLTSYPGRIKSVGLTVFSILQGTVNPDIIICNLALPEFPNKELDLPHDLQLMVKNSMLRINWVDVNSKQFKKIIPTMDLFPNDIIISIDDDLIYPTDFVAGILSDYHKHGEKYPITCGHFIDQGYYNSKPSHHGSFSLVSRNMFGKNYEVMKNLIAGHLWKELWFDDPLYTYAIMGNGLEYKLGSFNGYSYKKHFPAVGVSNQNDAKRHLEHVFLRKVFGV